MSETENVTPVEAPSQPDPVVDPVAPEVVASVPESPAEMVEEMPRPWHGAGNPFEALYQHFTAEIAKLRGQ